MNKSEISEILEKHAKWLNSEADGERANLRGANLCWANLRGANLCGANLCRANLYGADLCGANLYGANLRGANLYGANMHGANLRGANLYGANMHGANLREADLRGAGVIECIKTKLFPLACPEYGAFTAWKKLRGNLIAELLIPEDALRSSAYDRKCRANKAIVLSIVDMDGNDVDCGKSQQDINFIYKVGETVEVADFDTNRWNGCSTGIHFFITRQEAVDY